MPIATIARTLLLGSFFALQACSYSETPELTDFKLSSTDVEAGTTTNGTAMVEDDDGDLGGGKMVLTIHSGDNSEKKELPINLEDSTGKAALSVSMEISKLAPKGPATIDLQVFDKAGHASNVQTASLTIK
jgi:hypothetical protein